MFIDLNAVPLSKDWFLYEYIDADVKNKLDKTKRQLAGDEMENETKHYVEYLNQNTNWLNNFSIETDKILINSEYIDSLYKCICNVAKTKVLLHPSEN